MTDQTTAESVANAEVPQQPGFSLNDLKALHNIIEVAVSRGAFKAQELSTVGRVFDRLSAFLAATENTMTPEQIEQSGNPQ